MTNVITDSKIVFVVTDIFPPMAAVGVYRTTAVCRYLAKQGVTVKVITARHWDDELTDTGLLRLVPENIGILRTASPHLLSRVVNFVKFRGRERGTGHHVLPEVTAVAKPPRQTKRLHRLADWLSWWLHVPDTRIGWMLPGLSAGLREARRSRPSVIYATAPGWTSLLTGALLSHWTRVPFLADFQDPWCGSYWHRIPYAAQRRLDERLERFVVRRAARITCAWDGIRKNLLSRYPNRAEHIRTILNGFDAEEADHIQPIRLTTDRCVLLHAGTFYGPRSPQPLMAALQRLHAESPNTAQRLLVTLLGRPYYGGRQLSELARDYGVEDLVRIIPPVARGEALALTKGADVALLFGQSGYDDLASVPAKTFDYVGFGLPVLAIGTGEEACNVLRRGGSKLWDAPSDDASAIAAALRQIVEWHRNAHPNNRESDARLEFAWNSSAMRLAGEIHAVALQSRTRAVQGRASQSCL